MALPMPSAMGVANWLTPSMTGVARSAKEFMSKPPRSSPPNPLPDSSLVLELVPLASGVRGVATLGSTTAASPAEVEDCPAEVED